MSASSRPGIQPAAQENAHRHIARADGAGPRLCRGPAVPRRLPRRSLALVNGIGTKLYQRSSRHLALFDDEHRSGRQFTHASEDGVRRRRVTESQEQVDRSRIYLGVDRPLQERRESPNRTSAARQRPGNTPA